MRAAREGERGAAIAPRCQMIDNFLVDADGGVNVAIALGGLGGEKQRWTEVIIFFDRATHTPMKIKIYLLRVMFQVGNGVTYLD